MATPTSQLFHKLRMQRLPPLPTIKDLLKMYELQAIKQLSQNFLLDDKLTSKIVKAAGDVSNCVVVEVGPGPGGITRSILERGPEKVLLIEKDRRFKSLLQLLEDSCPGKVETFWGDVLSFEVSQLIPKKFALSWEDRCPNIHIIGNLPFSIATPLISRWFGQMSERKNAWEFGRVPLTLTFQKEVAERLTAKVDNEQRSRLSVMAEYLTHAYYKFEIRGSAFIPKPDVDVGVVKFIPRKEPLIKQPFKLVERLVRQTYCMRNKWCCRPISSLFPADVRLEFTKMLFDRSVVFPNLRPYQLTIEDFQRLCDAYASIINEYPEIWDYHYRGHKPDETWMKLYGSKYEAFQTSYWRAVGIRPMDVISDHLASQCEYELDLEAREREGDVEDDHFFYR